MKLRNFFNSNKREELFQEIKNDFKPIVEKVTVPVTTYAKNNPKKTFLLMIAVVIINIIFLFLFTDAFKPRKGIELNNLKFEQFKSGNQNGAVPEITVSFGNIRKVRMIKDSLAYLMSLPAMTFQDTLTFIRMMDEFHSISSGTSGIPEIKLDDLRKIKSFNNPITDSSIKK